MIARSGIGFDVHPLVNGRNLVLGGIDIPFDKGLSGHSDGDVLVHAIIDGLLGGAGLGDIGTHFPSGDPRYKGVSSVVLLDRTVDLLESNGWQPTYVDATIIAQNPVLSPFLDQMKPRLSASLGLDRKLVNLKATTTDGLGFTGRGEGIAALSVATVESTK